MIGMFFNYGWFYNKHIYFPKFLNQQKKGYFTQHFWNRKNTSANWKYARVIPINSKGCKQDASIQRPERLISNSCEAMERIVVKLS